MYFPCDFRVAHTHANIQNYQKEVTGFTLL